MPDNTGLGLRIRSNDRVPSPAKVSLNWKGGLEVGGEVPHALEGPSIDGVRVHHARVDSEIEPPSG